MASGLVALHTQKLIEPVASRYLGALANAVRAARLNKSFPDRRALSGTLGALAATAHGGIYEGVFVDSRSGLPNLASFTRALADKSVGLDALPRMDSLESLDARSDSAQVYEDRARKRRYFERLSRVDLAPVDEHRVLLRRHEPEHSRASFRVALTKLTGAGEYLRIVIELTQTSGLWAHKLVDLDERGEVASGTEALKAMVYRFASYDAETLFIRLHELEGMHVERVQRGILGPVLWSIPDDDEPIAVVEPHDNALTRAWLEAPPARDELQFIATFGSDVAAIDVREERSNDPLSPLLAEGIRDNEKARYQILRERHPFRVYKDRKFATTSGARPLVQGICAAAGTKNLVYALRG